MFAKVIKTLTITAIILALGVSMLGAFTRLTDAGLSCPDWPKCYGNFVLPKDKGKLRTIEQRYPDTPLEAKKAWTEMAHRYAAGFLGLLIFALLIISWRDERHLSLKYPLILTGLVIFQAILGMWTVVFKLFPIVVSAHLLGGFLIFVTLILFYCQQNMQKVSELITWRKTLIGGLVLIVLQIIMGGMVSTNYAGLACIGFPTCNGQLIPHIDFSQGQNIIKPIDGSYEGGVLSAPLRILIQYLHRFLGIIVVGYVLMTSILMFTLVESRKVHYLVLSLLVVVVLQFSLGVLNVILLMPVWTGVLHNCFAALTFALISVLVWTAGKNK